MPSVKQTKLKETSSARQTIFKIHDVCCSHNRLFTMYCCSGPKMLVFHQRGDFNCLHLGYLALRRVQAHISLCEGWPLFGTSCIWGAWYSQSPSPQMSALGTRKSPSLQDPFWHLYSLYFPTATLPQAVPWKGKGAYLLHSIACPARQGLRHA